MNTRKRIDHNQASIVDGLRRVGASVRSTAEIGQGFPDIAVGFRKQNFLFEIKDGDKPPSARKLTQQEREFFESWEGQVEMIESLADALKAIGASRT